MKNEMPRVEVVNGVNCILLSESSMYGTNQANPTQPELIGGHLQARTRVLLNYHQINKN